MEVGETDAETALQYVVSTASALHLDAALESTANVHEHAGAGGRAGIDVRAKALVGNRLVRAIDEGRDLAVADLAIAIRVRSATPSGSRD